MSPRVLLAGAGVALALAASALAQDTTPAKPVAATDKARDVKGPLDVRRVALGVTPGKQLRGEVTMRADWTTAALRTTTGPSGTVCLRLFTKRDPASEPPDYLVCASPATEGDELVGRVLRDRANGRPRRVGSAIVSRPTARTLYLRFTQTVIGKSATVMFAGEAIARTSGCPSPLGCRDTAPDAPAAATLQIR